MVPFQVTTVDAVKPPPFAVRVNVGPPAVALVGETLVRLSAGLIVKVSAGGDVWPDCATVTDAVPALAMSAAGTVAVN